MRILTPKRGYEQNPLLDLPRNAKCPCGSGKKIKHCHGSVRYVTNEFASKVRVILRSLNDEQKEFLKLGRS